MPIHKKTLFLFTSAIALGAIAYGAAIAYPVEQSGEPAVTAAPVIPALVRELPPPEASPIRTITIDSVEQLQHTFAAVDFVLAPIRRGHAEVPRLLLAALPRGYDAIEQVDLRKKLFFKTMLPLVLRVNEEILADRHRLVSLIAIMESGRDLAARDRDWLDRLAERYRVNAGEFATLLRRVDAVSPALTLAQSIEESGWGRSRFARSGNAMFGQRVWSQGSGLVPEARGESEVFEVRAFDELIDSVRAYALNLNRHYAYADYRVVRARLRATEVALDPYALANTLAGYSERREHYVETLKKIIRANRLEQFELARLRPGAPITGAVIERLARR